jgi:Fur family zinc uptake transcriptional regulator
MSGFTTAATSFATASHDHRKCIDGALRRAQSLCARQGARLTAQRRRVLELVWGSHKPVGAYELLARFAEAEGRSTAPATVYRALEFLQSHGLVHRIESLNAYVGCAHPERRHAGQFLICSDCGSAAELHDPNVVSAIAKGAAKAGFEIHRQTVEVEGRCPQCRDGGRAA